MFLLAACIHVISCAVWHAACVFHGLCAFKLSWLVWTRCFWVLISCVFVSCFAHGWWIVCWPCTCVFVLCEHLASVLVFCVPCALMSICLDPTHLVTCLWINFPQLLSLVTLLICSLYNLLVFAVLCGFVAIRQTSYALCPALPCPALPCPALPCPALPCPALPCPALPCPARQSVFPLQGCFCLFCFIINKKPFFFLLQLGPRSLPITRTWHSLPGYTELITFL